MKKKNSENSKISEALAALSAMSEEEKLQFLAGLDSKTVSKGLQKRREKERERKAREAEEQARREKALSERMGQISKILDDCEITGRVVFERDDQGAWHPRVSKKRSGARGNGNRRKPLTDEDRLLIDSYVKAGKRPEPDKDSINSHGTAGAFFLENGDGKEVRLTAIPIIEHLMKTHGIKTEKQMNKVAPWFSGGQIRRALNNLNGYDQ